MVLFFHNVCGCIQCSPYFISTPENDRIWFPCSFFGENELFPRDFSHLYWLRRAKTNVNPEYFLVDDSELCPWTDTAIFIHPHHCKENSILHSVTTWRNTIMNNHISFSPSVIQVAEVTWMNEIWKSRTLNERSKSMKYLNCLIYFSKDYIEKLVEVPRSGKKRVYFSFCYLCN